MHRHRISRSAAAFAPVVLAALSLLGACSLSSRPVKTYREFSYAWSHHNGRAVHRLVSQDRRKTSTPAYWRLTSREPGRRVLPLDRKSVV